MLFDVVAGVFEQVAVLHAAGADGFAGAAAEAKVNMADGGVAQRQPTVLHGAHQV